jgi:hypothetical protein
VGTYLDTILCYKDSLSGGAFEALSVASGESLSLRWFGEGTQAHLLDAFGGNNAHLCEFQIRSPLLHDNVHGIRMKYMFNPTMSGADGNPQAFLAPYFRQKLTPTDTLIVECNGTASDDVSFGMTVLYDAPAYTGGRFITADEVEARNVNLVGISTSPSAAASTSTYGTAEAINSDDNRLKANTDYALIGATSDLPFTFGKVYGPDTGNLGVGISGAWDEKTQAGYFYEMSKRWHMPLVPVINSNNASVTSIQVADVGGGTNPTIALQFVELA